MYLAKVMKLSKLTYFIPVIAVFLIAVSENAKSAELSRADDDILSNADLNHLISILDVNGTDSGMTTSQNVTNQNISDQSARVTPLAKTVLIKRKIRVKKYMTNSTSVPLVFTTTITSVPQTTTKISSPQPVTTVSKPPIVESTSSIPIVKVSDFPVHVDAERRVDSHIDTLQEITPPSQQDLVQQLSLLNSLLTSLGDNVTTTNSTSLVASTTPTTMSATATESPNIVLSRSVPESSTSSPNNDQQTLEALSAIFGGTGIGSNGDAAASLLGGLGLEGHSNVATRQITPGSETEAAKALSEFLFQAAAIEAQRSNNDMNNAQNQNLNTNLNTATAASNQFSGLVSLLGTLNALAPQQSGQENPLQGLGPGQNIQHSQLDPQQLLTAFSVAAQQQQRQQPHSLSDLFSQPQQHSSFDLGKLLSSQGQVSAGGILSSIGTGLTSLGSSMFSTISNIFSGSGLGGKPRVRGVDTRMGLGYRFGDAADAQIMWDVGPQLFTEPVKNELRSPTMGKKSQTVDPNEELIRSLSGSGKQQDAISAAKRVLQLQMQREMKSHHLNQKQFSPTAVTPKKPLSLLDIWNAGKDETTVMAPRFHIPEQLLTPPLNEADRLQMLRNKSFRKRSSTSLKNYYSKPVDDPLSGHSTLTVYEQMLIKEGKDLGTKFADAEEEEPIPTRRPTRRRKSRPPPPPSHLDEHNNDDDLPVPEYGNDSGISASPKKKKPLRGKGGSREKKRLSKMRPRPSNDKHKWKPRGNDNAEDVLKEEIPRDSKPFHDELDNKEQVRHESMESKGRPRGSRERDQPDNFHESQDDIPDDRPPPSRDDFRFEVELEPAHSESRPQFDDGPEDEFESEYDEVDEFESPSRPTEDDETHHGSREKPRDVYHGSKEMTRNKPYHGKGSRERTRDRPKYGSKERPDDDTYYWPKDKSQDDPHGSKERPYHNSQQGPRERPYDDGTDDDGPRHIQRPKHEDHKKEEPRPHFKSKPRRPHKKPQSTREHKTSKPKFSLAKIFHYWVGKGRRQTKRKSKKPPADRRKQEDDSMDEAYERFTYKEPDLPKSRSDDRFRSRNKFRSRRPRPQSSFNRKISPLLQLRRGGGGIPYSPQVNPEANDSFLRRNQVAVNNRLKEIERQKLLETQSKKSESPSASSIQEYDHISTTPSPTNSVMHFVKNYFSSKTASKSSSNSASSGSTKVGDSTRPHSISTLAKLISNPSALNPLKILPIRRNRVRPSPQKLQVRHKLAVINGKLQIVNVTVIPTTTTTTESPIVHIGDDMSFEELTQVLSAVKKNRKKKLKLKVKNKSEPEKKKDDDDYEGDDFVEKSDGHFHAQEKVDDETNKPNQVDKTEQDPDYDANDGLKGIFIDIESGEVNVLKPVAELTSFLPKKEEEVEEPSTEIVDELDDDDGDGIADKEMRRKSEIFSEIQTELKKNYDQMKKDHERVEAKKRRKEQLAAQGMDESIDVVSKYFDMVER